MHLVIALPTQGIDYARYRPPAATTVSTTLTELTLVPDTEEAWEVTGASIAVPAGLWVVRWRFQTPGWRSDWTVGVRTTLGDTTGTGFPSSSGILDWSSQVESPGALIPIASSSSFQVSSRVMPATATLEITEA